MARRKPADPPPPKWPLRVVAIGIFLAEVAFLRGATSQFRLPKDAIVLAALCLAIGLAVTAAARRGTFTFPRGPLTMVLLVLPVLQAVSALWSASPTRALESAAFSFIWVIGIFWLATLEARSRHRLAVIAAVGVAVSAAAMLLQISGVQVFDLGRGFTRGRQSLTGLTGNPADLAMAAVLLLPLLLVRRKNSPLPRYEVFLVLVLSLATLLTRTLSGIGALAVLCIVWLAQQRSRKLWSSALAVGGVFLVVALAFGLGTRLILQYERVRHGDWYQLLSARGDGWNAAAEMVYDRPILGVGAANYDYLYYPSRLDSLTRRGGTGRRGELASHFEWAHCDPLQLVAELGVVGLLWLIALLAALGGARKRAGPVFGLGAAAVTPFALLHYPTHLAVGLIPIALILGEIIGATEIVQMVDWRRTRVPVALLLIAVAVVGAWWQLRRVKDDLWMGKLEDNLVIAAQARGDLRYRRAAQIEAASLSRIDRMPRQAPILWLTVGRARNLRKDFKGAEEAFRKAFAGWPHEDADFQLGLTLVALGRRSEGLQHLGRVCRTNPALIRTIHDPDLRRAVKDVLDVYRAR